MPHVAHTSERKRTDDVAATIDKANQNAIHFSQLLLKDNVLGGLLTAGFSHPSPVQVKAIPLGRFGAGEAFMSVRLPNDHEVFFLLCCGRPGGSVQVWHWKDLRVCSCCLGQHPVGSTVPAGVLLAGVCPSPLCHSHCWLRPSSSPPLERLLSRYVKYFEQLAARCRVLS